MDFAGKIQMKGSDWFIGGFQSGSLICIEGLNLQAGRLRSHVNGLMTDLGLFHVGAFIKNLKKNFRPWSEGEKFVSLTAVGLFYGGAST